MPTTDGFPFSSIWMDTQMPRQELWKMVSRPNWSSHPMVRPPTDRQEQVRRLEI